MSIDSLSFQNIYAFWILSLLLIIFLISKNKKNYEHIFSKDMLEKIVLGKSKTKTNLILMIIAFILLVLSLARPVILNDPIKVSQNELSIVVAFDISKSMTSQDVYPNRLEFAKNKFNHLLKNLKDEKVGAIGFSSSSFLIAPITNDYFTLKYLIKNLSTSYVSVKGSDVYQALQSTNDLLKNNKDKALIILTDGTDTSDFTQSIDFAKRNNIKVFVYAIATLKGSVIKTKNGVLKDNNGNIVITRLNNAIKQLAFETNGAYLEYSSSPNDIKKFVDMIRLKFQEDDNKKKDIVINTNYELFYFPLALAFLLIFISLSGFKRSVN